MYRIVLVDDETQVLKSLQRELKRDDREINVFTEAVEAIDHISTTEVDLVISDYRMPLIDGVHFLTKIKRLQPDAVRIILSGQTDFEGLKNAINDAEIYRFINKPWDSYDLKQTVDHALSFRQLQVENTRLVYEVRTQRDQLKVQEDEIERLEKMQPGITKVKRDADGAIIID